MKAVVVIGLVLLAQAGLGYKIMGPIGLVLIPAATLAGSFIGAVLGRWVYR